MRNESPVSSGVPGQAGVLALRDLPDVRDLAVADGAGESHELDLEAAASGVLEHDRADVSRLQVVLGQVACEDDQIQLLDHLLPPFHGYAVTKRGVGPLTVRELCAYYAIGGAIP